jgi:glyoxylase-like metal-dependent hydrolase (beta-lactamase superfamily II)
MPAVRFDIISIGALGRNRLWNESEVVRTAHATTTLIRTGKQNLLVDPGLPAPALGARLFERTGLRPEQIDTVFLTCFLPAHRAGLSLFANSKLRMQELEIRAARTQLEELLDRAEKNDPDRAPIRQELSMLDSIEPADDSLMKQVDLFPLFGYTPGSTGLILAMPTMTVLLAGGAVATQEHFLAGQVLQEAFDLEASKQSLQEIYEIADLVIPGYDNLFVNPRMHGM